MPSPSLNERIELLEKLMHSLIKELYGNKVGCVLPSEELGKAYYNLSNCHVPQIMKRIRNEN